MRLSVSGHPLQMAAWFLVLAYLLHLGLGKVRR